MKMVLKKCELCACEALFLHTEISPPISEQRTLYLLLLDFHTLPLMGLSFCTKL